MNEYTPHLYHPDRLALILRYVGEALSQWWFDQPEKALLSFDIANTLTDEAFRRYAACYMPVSSDWN